MSKPRWEVKFERYMSEEPVSEKIESLSKAIEDMKNGKIKGEFKTKEEYEEAKSKHDGDIRKLENELEGYQNYERNKGKIENIYEYRKSLEEKLAKLPKDKSKQIEQGYKYLENARKELTTARAECDKLTIEINGLNYKLKGAKAEDKASIKEEIAKKRETLGNAQDKQSELMEKISDAQELLDKIKAEDKEFDKYTNKRLEYERKIAKCNILAANLLKGKDINDIELNVESKDSRFTAKGEDAEKAKNIRESAKGLGIDSTTLGTDGVKKEDETALSKLSEFAKKHPRLAKIGNFFKNVKDKVVNSFKGKEAKSVEPKKVAEEKIFEDEDKALYEIAKNGHDAYIRTLREAAKQKAANEYAEKYGGQYEKQDGATAKKKESDELEK